MHKKVSRSKIKKEKSRKNPTATLALLNKYAGKPILFVFRTPADDPDFITPPTNYNTNIKEAVLMKPDTDPKTPRYARGMWRVIIKKNWMVFLIDPKDLSKIEIKEQYPYPIFNYNEYPKYDHIYSKIKL